MAERPVQASIAPAWLQYDRYCRAFTSGAEYELWDRERALYRQMQSLERVPTVSYGQASLADVVFAFNSEIDRKLAQGQLAGKTFLFSLEGLTAAGKDYVGEKYVIPAIETHLARLRLRDPSIPALKVLSWDATQDRLRTAGDAYQTPPGGISTPEELVLTKNALISEISEITDREDKTTCEVAVVKLLSGTALNEADGVWFEEPRKIYGDRILEPFIRRSSVIEGSSPADDVIIARAALELGPWIQVWQYYRWIMLQTHTKEEADQYNRLFHLDPFATEDEWRQYLQWNGGDPATIGNAIRVANVMKNRLKQFGRVLSPHIPSTIFQDIRTVAKLLGVDYYSMKEVCLTLLGHAMVHENNMRLSGVPEYLSAVIYNNPRIELTAEELIDLMAILKDLIIDEKNAAADMKRL